MKKSIATTQATAKLWVLHRFTTVKAFNHATTVGILMKSMIQIACLYVTYASEGSKKHD